MRDDRPDEFERQAEEAYVMTQYFAAQQRRERERRALENQPFAADVAVRRFRRAQAVSDGNGGAEPSEGAGEAPLSGP